MTNVTVKQLWEQITELAIATGYQLPYKSYVGKTRLTIEQLLLDIRNNREHAIALTSSPATTQIRVKPDHADQSQDIRLLSQESTSGFDGSQIKSSKDDYVNGIPKSYENVSYQVSDNAIASEDIEHVNTMSAIKSNAIDIDDDLTVSGSKQDALFWLRRVYLSWSEYHCLTDAQTVVLQDKLHSGLNKQDRENAIARLQNSERFKEYLTFKCPYKDTKAFDDFLKSCDRLNLLVVENDDLFDGKCYNISPNWEYQTGIKFTTIMRILKFSDREIEINQDYLTNVYISISDSVFRVPCAIALDILTGSIVPNSNNQVLTSAIRLNIGNTYPTVNIGDREYRVLDGLQLPSSDRQAISNSVSIRKVANKVKSRRVESKATGTYREPSDRNDWIVLSQRVTSTETSIIGMNTAKYRDCILMYRPYQLELNEFKQLATPKLLENTLTVKGIKPDRVLGYIGVRYPSGKVDKLGIVYLHDKKDKLTKEVRRQLWYTDIIRYNHKQLNTVVNTDNYTMKNVTKFTYDENKTIRKQTVMTMVADSVVNTAIASQKQTKDSDLSIFMSLYGLNDNSAIRPAKLAVIGNEQKQINVNWHSLTGLKVAPMNKEGSIIWEPRYYCPYTVI